MPRKTLPKLNNLPADVLLSTLSFLNSKEKARLEVAMKMKSTVTEQTWKESLQKEYKMKQNNIDTVKATFLYDKNSRYKSVYLFERRELALINQRHEIKSDEKAIELRNQLNHDSFSETRIHLDNKKEDMLSEQGEYLRSVSIMFDDGRDLGEELRKAQRKRWCVIL